MKETGLISRTGLLVCAGLLAVWAFATAGSSRQKPFVARNVVLVTVDTLRADHLGCYGYPRDTSPVLDRLAAEGVRFRHAFAAMATTVPSHASLLTSRAPLELKVLRNGHRLAGDVPTLAEMLAAGGFETAAFVSTDAHFVASGLDRGFQVFDEPDLGETTYRPASETVRRAVDWLTGRDRNRPLFLWVHLFDPHLPYQPLHRLEPESPRERERLTRFKLRQQRVDLGFYGGDESAMLATMNLYDGEVRAVDAAVGELVAAARGVGLATADPSAGTVWVVTGDHGEGLGNHQWAGHGKHIYNEQLRVPLIFHLWPPMAATGTAPEGVVELLDLLPTLLELSGLEAPVGHELRGRSLVPQLKGGQGTSEARMAFAQRRAFDPPRGPQDLSAPSANFESGEKFALQDGHFKYILWTAGPDELYAVDRDPYETENLIGRFLPEEKLYRRRLRRRIAGLRSSGHPQGVTDEATEGLKSLGYGP